MIDLDLMQYKNLLQVREIGGKSHLFDPLRKKWLVLQPEELVRQLFVQYLLRERGYNITRIKIEKSLKVNDLNRRCDLLAYDSAIRPFLMVECKAPRVDISQKTFRQIAWYNLPMQVPYLAVTNGRQTYCCAMNYEERRYDYLEEIPVFPV